MSSHTFALVPPPRYSVPPAISATPWTQLLPEESLSSSGPWAALATQAIVPDPSPETSNPVSVQIDDATIDSGFFRFRWRTDSLATSPPTDPVRSPSQGLSVIGPVYAAARAIIPISWDALAKPVNLGAEVLQGKIDLVKLRVLGSLTSVNDEASLDLRVLDYCAKLAALEVIPSAIDYWMDQIVSQTSRGSDEGHTFPDRIAALKRQQEALLLATRAARLEVEAVLGTTTGRRTSAPAVDTIGPLITPGLEHFPAPYDLTPYERELL